MRVQVVTRATYAVTYEAYAVAYVADAVYADRSRNTCHICGYV